MRPRKQKQRKMSEDRILAAKAEVQRLLDAKVIREVKYLEWLANIVLVPKKNGKMRMCIDFTDLNKACKKDPFPLPRIDASVDKAARCQRFSPRLLLRVSPNLDEKRRRRQDKFHHSIWDILLHQNAGGPQKCRSNLCQNDKGSFGLTTR